MSKRSRSKSQLEQLFSIDYRGLAVFRIIVALVAILKALDGIVESQWDLAAIWDWIAMLVAASLLAFGHLKTVVSFVIWFVLCQRFSSNVGTYLLIIATMWCVFLPTDRFLVWFRKPTLPQAKSYLSLATAALMLQVFFIYFQAGLSKNWDEWLTRATAIQDLTHTHYVSALGRRLLAWPFVQQATSVLTIAIEVLVPLVLFIPGRRLNTIRLLGVFLMVFMHLGMILTMTLDTIPVISIAFWFLFVPTQAWDRVWPISSERGTHCEPEPWCNRLALPLVSGMLLSISLSWVWPYDSSATLSSWQNRIPRVGLYQEWRMFSSPATLRLDEEQTTESAA